MSSQAEEIHGDAWKGRDSNSRTFWERQSRGAVKRSVGKRGGMSRRHSGDFRGSDPALREAVMLETCPHTVVQTHRMRSTKHDPRCELWASGDNDVSA